MIDIKRIRDNPETVKAALLKRMDAVDFTEVLAWDRQRKEINHRLDALRQRRNAASKRMPLLKANDEYATELRAEMKLVGEETKRLESEESALGQSLRVFLDALPNIPDADVVEGGKENNEVVRSWGEKPQFWFNALDHVDLVTKLRLVDYKRGAKLGGNGFWMYTGNGALLEWALINYFVREHLNDGYELILPPHILTNACGYTAGQFPKFADDVFTLDKAQHFLLPTAETALVNIYRDEILQEDDLPRKLFSYTPCYRREGGSYRTNERGMIRGHQFNKVELFQYTRPEDSDAALEEMIGKAQRLVSALGLHYRVSKLAARDCSASMAKTLDIEVWIPSMGEYKEVSSASNARDFQARRGNMRFRRKGSNGIEHMHTLNASGLATSRLVPAMVEQLQREDGSVVVPEVLRGMVGKDVLRPID